MHFVNPPAPRILHNHCFQFLLGITVVPSLHSKSFRASSSRKLGREQKKKEWGGRGKALPFFFFCSRSSFRAITRLETLATQARTTSVKNKMSVGITRLTSSENSVGEIKENRNCFKRSSPGIFTHEAPFIFSVHSNACLFTSLCSLAIQGLK